MRYVFYWKPTKRREIVIQVEGDVLKIPCTLLDGNDEPIPYCWDAHLHVKKYGENTLSLDILGSVPLGNEEDGYRDFIGTIPSYGDYQAEIELSFENTVITIPRITLQVMKSIQT